MNEYSDDAIAAGLRLRPGVSRALLGCAGVLAFLAGMALPWVVREYPWLHHLRRPHPVPASAPASSSSAEQPRPSPPQPVTSESEREELRARLLGRHPGGRPAQHKPSPRDLELRALERLYGSNLKKERPLLAAHMAPAEVNAPALAGADGADGREGLSPTLIQAVIAENSRAMSLCAAEAARRGEDVAGKLDVELTIRPEGRVDHARIATEGHRRTELGSCVIRRAMSLKFPAFRGRPITVVYPYVIGG